MINFSSEPIPEDVKHSMKAKNIWSEKSPVLIENLRLLTLSHYDFAENLLSGQMVVHEKISSNIVLIFQELLVIKFPIEKIRLIDYYNGDDKLSMSDNNSSSFNDRFIENTNIISMHAYGLAIDINPVQNPYIFDDKIENMLKILPDSGKKYLNRTNQRAGMVESIVPIFAKYGLIWGGSWNSPIDYHHFQINRDDLSSFL